MQGIFTRLESPYETDCYQSWTQTNYSTQFLNSTNWPYSFMVRFGYLLLSVLFSPYLQQCKRFCVLDAVMQDCDCFHPLYLDIDDTRHNKVPCDLSDSETDSCIKAVMTQFSRELRSCPCQQACYQTQYTAAVSSAFWPAKLYEASQGLTQIIFSASCLVFRLG